MANLTACPSCYTVKLPSCFDSLVITLDSSTSYDAVFTNHFGKKKIIEVTSEDDGSIAIGADEFPDGYFTPFNSVTLEFFKKSSGGYSGYDTENAEGCEAVTVCGRYKCFTLEFYEADHVEAATIKCCAEPVAGSSCCESTVVVTIGDLIPLHRATLSNGWNSFLVFTDNADFGYVNNISLIYNISEVALSYLQELDPNANITDLFVESEDVIIRHLACPDNPFGLDPVIFAPPTLEPFMILTVERECGFENDECLSGAGFNITIEWGNMTPEQAQSIVVHGVTEGGGDLTWNVNTPTAFGSETLLYCVPNGSTSEFWATADGMEETEHQTLSAECPVAELSSNNDDTRVDCLSENLILSYKLGYANFESDSATILKYKTSDDSVLTIGDQGSINGSGEKTGTVNLDGLPGIFEGAEVRFFFEVGDIVTNEVLIIIPDCP